MALARLPVRRVPGPAAAAAALPAVPRGGPRSGGGRGSRLFTGNSGPGCGGEGEVLGRGWAAGEEEGYFLLPPTGKPAERWLERGLGGRGGRVAFLADSWQGQSRVARRLPGLSARRCLEALPAGPGGVRRRRRPKAVPLAGEPCRLPQKRVAAQGKGRWWRRGGAGGGGRGGRQPPGSLVLPCKSETPLARATSPQQMNSAQTLRRSPHGAPRNVRSGGGETRSRWTFLFTLIVWINLSLGSWNGQIRSWIAWRAYFPNPERRRGGSGRLSGPASRAGQRRRTRGARPATPGRAARPALPRWPPRTGSARHPPRLRQRQQRPPAAAAEPEPGAAASRRQAALRGGARYPRARGRRAAVNGRPRCPSEEPPPPAGQRAGRKSCTGGFMRAVRQTKEEMMIAVSQHSLSVFSAIVFPNCHFIIYLSFKNNI